MLRQLCLPLVGMMLLAPPPARADIPEILACIDLTDPKAKFACYDAAAIKLRAELAEEEKRKNTLFGFTLPFADADKDSVPQPDLGPKDVTAIDTKLDSWTKDSSGRYLLTLDNGQVWVVVDYRPVPIHGAAAPSIAITRNLLGGYYMSVNGGNNELSVKRVR